MKRILVPVICLWFIQSVYAQKNTLALDENNKYIYYQVVNMPGNSADSLSKKALAFLLETYPKSGAKQAGDSAATVQDKFVTYSALAVAKHEGGEIHYTFNIECKANKYRYWLTDFIFIPYERNRYSVYVPVSSKEMPLEKIASKLDKKEADSNFAQTADFCKQTGDRLVAYMMQEHKVNKPGQQPAVKKVVTDKW